MRLAICIAAAAAAAVVLAASPASAVNYMNVADSTGPFGAFSLGDTRTVAMNNTGYVAFRATLDAGGSGIFLNNGHVVANTTGAFSAFGGLSIDDDNLIAFQADRTSGGPGIFVTGPGGITNSVATWADTSGGFLSFGVNPATGFDSVAFTGARPRVGDAIAFATNGFDWNTIASTTPDASNFTAVGARPSINFFNTAAFHATTREGDTGIFTYATSTGARIVIADTGGAFSDFRDWPSINFHDTVAFVATLDAGGEGVYTGTGVPFTGSGSVPTVTNLVADSTGPYDTFGFVSLSGRNTLAFVATLDAGGRGIFTGPDPVAHRVIATGDALFGSTVTDVNFYTDGLIELNQLAFVYELANGTTGIAVATGIPIPIPEPAALPLLALATAATLPRRRRRGRRNERP
jgi:hypothetical protein